MMKLSVVLFVALVASVCANDMDDAHQKQIMEMYKRCLDKVKMTMEELQKFSKENKPNPKMDCFHGCIFAEQHVLKEDGSVNKQLLEEIVKSIAKHQNGKAAEAFKKCLDFKKKLTLCEAGRVLEECFKKMPH